MANEPRARTIQPTFFVDERLFDTEAAVVEAFGPAYTGLVRLTLAALWCQADREGRFEVRRRQLKVASIPFDRVDFDRILNALRDDGWISTFFVDGEEFGQIRDFAKSQHINPRERQSKLPKSSNDPRQGELFDVLWDGCRFRTNTGELVGVTTKQLETWKGAFPSVDIEGELRIAASWLESNPKNRKTSRGMTRFLNAWLGRCHDKGGRSGMSVPLANGSPAKANKYEPRLPQ